MKMWWAELRWGFKSLYFFVFPVYFGIPISTAECSSSRPNDSWLERQKTF